MRLTSCPAFRMPPNPSDLPPPQSVLSSSHTGTHWGLPMFERLQATFTARTKKLREEWIRKPQFLVAIIAVIALCNLSIPAMFAIISRVTVDSALTQFVLSFCPEAVGIAFTVFVLNRLAEQREERREKVRLKEKLIEQLKSQKNEYAIRAAEELANQGWLQDGSLNREDFSGVQWHDAPLVKAQLQEVILIDADLEKARLNFSNLHKADLRAANFSEANLGNIDLSETDMSSAELPEADLHGANLQDANLDAANLQGAHLQGACLQDARLQKANLRNAELQDANLRGADFSDADMGQAKLSAADLRRAELREANLFEVNLLEAKLQGANLTDAHLQAANLYRAQFDESTILPDGSHWTPDTDMKRFTHLYHRKFWLSPLIERRLNQPDPDDFVDD